MNSFLCFPVAVETPVKLTLFVACTCMTFLSVGVALRWVKGELGHLYKLWFTTCVSTN